MTTRQQLTLFASTSESQSIEQARRRYNPEQYALIQAHVTLCREDELTNTTLVVQNLEKLRAAPVVLEFASIERFANGTGLLLPAFGEWEAFNELRRTILHGVIETPRRQVPHLTLMHPRNSTCTDAIFNQLRNQDFPRKLQFSTVSLIEQQHNQRWEVLRTFPLSV